jgi:formate dehydrogenase major subunit
MIIREDYRDAEDLGGVFSGWDEQKKKYNPESWRYEGSQRKDGSGNGDGKAGHADAAGGHGKDRGGESAQMTDYEADPTMQDPNCVFQIMRRHFARPSWSKNTQAFRRNFS